MPKHVCPKCNRRKRKRNYDRHVAACRTYVSLDQGGGGEDRLKRIPNIDVKRKAKEKRVEENLKPSSPVMTEIEISIAENRLRDVIRGGRSRKK